MSYRSQIERLADPDFAVRKRVVRQLVQAGEAAVPELRAALDDPRLTVQIRALEALGLLRDVGSIGAFQALTRNTDSGLAEEAAIALVRLRDAALADGDAASVRACDAALEGFAHRVADRNDVLYLRSAPALVAARDAADRRAVAERDAAEFRSQTTLPDDVDGLVGMLRHPNFPTRKAAGEKLAGLGAPVVPALVAEAARETPLSAIRAIEAVGRTGERDAVDALVRLRAQLRDPDLKVAASGALYTLLERLAPTLTIADLDLLLTLVERWRGYPAAAQVAVAALGRLAQTDPCPELRRALKWLKGSFFSPVPPEFAAAWKAIDAATAHWRNLPIPALAPPPATTDLPRPSEKLDDRA